VWGGKILFFFSFLSKLCFQDATRPPEIEFYTPEYFQNTKWQTWGVKVEEFSVTFFVIFIDIK
jgi:hypothetical protein